MKLNLKLSDLFETYKTPIFIFLGVILLAVVAWASNSFPRKSVMQEILNEQEKKIKSEYIQTISKQDKVIKELENKLQNSKIIVNGLNDEITRLANKKGKIYEPKTRKETIDRFNNLGYTPIK